MFGLVEPSTPDLPRLENEAIASLTSYAPTAYASGLSPGDWAVSQFGPVLPLANAGKMPAASQARTVSRYHVSPCPPPHEELTTSACRSGLGLLPARSVGAITHCPEARSEVLEHELDSHPLAAIHFAPGATPIWLPAPSSPTIV